MNKMIFSVKHDRDGWDEIGREIKTLISHNVRCVIITGVILVKHIIIISYSCKHSDILNRFSNPLYLAINTQ